TGLQRRGGPGQLHGPLYQRRLALAVLIKRFSVFGERQNQSQRQRPLSRDRKQKTVNRKQEEKSRVGTAHQFLIRNLFVALINDGTKGLPARRTEEAFLAASFQLLAISLKQNLGCL